MTPCIRGLLGGVLLSLWTLPAFAQGQLLNGDRTLAGGLNAGTATGAVNTFALTLNPALPAYLDRQCFTFKANLANTGVATLNVNGLGAKTLKKRVAGVSTDLAANDIGLGQYVSACYDGTVMQVQSLGGGGSGSGTLTALTGDVTASGSGSVAATLASIPSGVPMVGSLLATAISAPGTPAAGKGSLYVDSTSKNLAVKDDAGLVKHGIQTITCGAGLFVSAINDAGLPTCATPAGGGNVSATGSPTSGLTAEWTSGTVIAGIGTSGTGLYVKQTSASLITPTLGVATATSLNKVTITAPATGSTLTIANGKTLTASNSLTLTGTDGSSVDVASGGTMATLGNTNTFTGRQNAGGAVSTAPHKVGTSLPGTCTVGDTFFKSDATAGVNIYACTATNTWTVETGGAGSSGTVVSGTANQAARYSATGTTVGGSSGLLVGATSILAVKNDVTHITTNTTLGTHNLVTCTSGSSTVTVTLPAANATPVGRYTIVKDDTGVGECDIARAGSDTLNGAVGPVRLTGQWASASVELVDAGSPGNWYVIAAKAALGAIQLPVGAATLPSSNAAIIDVSEPRPKLLYDATTSWCASWTVHLPPDYGTIPSIVFDYSMTSATSGSVSMGWSAWKTTSAEAVDAQTGSYGTANTCTDAAVPGTAGRMKTITCLLTNDDTMVANDLVTIKGCRDIADSATGNVELLSAQLQYIKN